MTQHPHTFGIYLTTAAQGCKGVAQPLHHGTLFHFQSEYKITSHVSVTDCALFFFRSTTRSFFLSTHSISHNRRQSQRGRFIASNFAQFSNPHQTLRIYSEFKINFSRNYLHSRNFSAKWISVVPKKARTWTPEGSHSGNSQSCLFRI